MTRGLLEGARDLLVDAGIEGSDSLFWYMESALETLPIQASRTRGLTDEPDEPDAADRSVWREGASMLTQKCFGVRHDGFSRQYDIRSIRCIRLIRMNPRS